MKQCRATDVNVLKFSVLMTFLLEEKSAMEYIDEEIRDYSNVAKSKIHYAEGDKNYGMSQIELMQKQMGETLQKVV